jgi:uncharacterized protein YecT (DUF1311 family)
MCTAGAGLARSQSAFDYCEKAKHTGDMIACVKKHYDDTTQKLNKTYEDVLVTQSDEDAEAFRTAQQDWIAYRDKECAWEISQVQTESLRRHEELECLTRLSMLRLRVLDEYLETHADYKEPQGIKVAPRWINVLAEEKPDMFWQYGSRLNTDLNCDDTNEDIILGQQIKLENVRVEGQDPHTVHTTVAVIENTLTGKPKTEFFSITQKGELCSPEIKLGLSNKKIEPASPEDSNENEQEEPACNKSLNIVQQGCASYNLYWDGTSYMFEDITNN